MISEKKIERFLLLVLTILLGSILSVIIISLNKGFDFTDEGGFLLSYKNVNLYHGGIYNYHIIIERLTRWMNPGIITYRWLSLFITLASSFTLAFGLYRWLNAVYKNESFYKKFLFIFCFISIGNFLFYFLGMQTIHNNTLTNFALQTATGIILYLFSYDALQLPGSKKNLFLILITGFICAFSFFIKFTTGIFQLSAYFLMLSIYLRQQPVKHIFIAISTLLLGTAIGVFIYFSFFQSYVEWHFNFRKEYSMLSDHSPVMLVKSYAYTILQFIKFLLLYFSWLLVFPLFIVMKRYFPSHVESKNSRHVKNFFLFLSILIFICEIYRFGFYRSTFTGVEWINAYFYIIVISLQLLLLSAIGLMHKINVIRFLKINLNKALIIFLLSATPFIGALGTANPLFLNALMHAAPWFGVIIILLIYLSDYIKNKIILSLFIIIPGLVTASQIIDGNIFIPYYSISGGSSRGYFAQTEEVESLPLLKGVYVDLKTKTFLIELSTLLKKNNYIKGYPLLGFHMPGVVYLLEGISPGMPYYFNTKRDRQSFDCFKPENNPPIIMLTDGNPINPELLKSMQNKGVIFPDDYLLKGAVYFPNRKAILKVYFPKNYLPL